MAFLIRILSHSSLGFVHFFLRLTFITCMTAWACGMHGLGYKKNWLVHFSCSCNEQRRVDSCCSEQVSKQASKLSACVHEKTFICRDIYGHVWSRTNSFALFEISERCISKAGKRAEIRKERETKWQTILPHCQKFFYSFYRTQIEALWIIRMLRTIRPTSYILASSNFVVGLERYRREGEEEIDEWPNYVKLSMPATHSVIRTLRQ